MKTVERDCRKVGYKYNQMSRIKKCLAYSVQPSNYGCTREVAKHEGGVMRRGATLAS